MSSSYTQRFGDGTERTVKGRSSSNRVTLPSGQVVERTTIVEGKEVFTSDSNPSENRVVVSQMPEIKQSDAKQIRDITFDQGKVNIQRNEDNALRVQSVARLEAERIRDAQRRSNEAEFERLGREGVTAKDLINKKTGSNIYGTREGITLGLPQSNIGKEDYARIERESKQSIMREQIIKETDYNDFDTISNGRDYSISSDNFSPIPSNQILKEDTITAGFKGYFQEIKEGAKQSGEIARTYQEAQNRIIKKEGLAKFLTQKEFRESYTNLPKVTNQERSRIKFIESTSSRQKFVGLAQTVATLPFLELKAVQAISPFITTLAVGSVATNIIMNPSPRNIGETIAETSLILTVVNKGNIIRGGVKYIKGKQDINSYITRAVKKDVDAGLQVVEWKPKQTFVEPLQITDARTNIITTRSRTEFPREQFYNVVKKTESGELITYRQTPKEYLKEVRRTSPKVIGDELVGLRIFNKQQKVLFNEAVKKADIKVIDSNKPREQFYNVVKKTESGELITYRQTPKEYFDVVRRTADRTPDNKDISSFFKDMDVKTKKSLQESVLSKGTKSSPIKLNVNKKGKVFVLQDVIKPKVNGGVESITASGQVLIQKLEKPTTIILQSDLSNIQKQEQFSVQKQSQSQISSQNQKEQLLKKVKSISDFKPISKSKLQSQLSFALINLPKSEQVSSKVLGLKQVQVQKQVLLQRQRNKQEQFIDLINVQSQSKINLQKPISKNVVITKNDLRSKQVTDNVLKSKSRLPSLNSKSKSLNDIKSKVLGKAFAVLLKRRGRFVKIAGGLGREKALDVGTRSVKGSIGATFQIKEEGGFTSDVKSTGEFQRYQNELRNYAVRKGRRVALQDTYIQRRGTRLGTRAEVSSINASKKYFKGKGGVI